MKKDIIETIRTNSSVFKDYNKLIEDNNTLYHKWGDTIKAILDSFVDKEIYGKPLFMNSNTSGSISESNPMWKTDSYSWCSLKYDMEDFDGAELWFDLYRSKIATVDRILLKVNQRRFNIFREGDVIKATANVGYDHVWTSPEIKQDKLISILENNIIVEIAETMEKLASFEKINNFLSK